MCLIIDANLCSVIFKQNNDIIYSKLRKLIFSNRITIVHGGQLTTEYDRAGVLSMIAMLAQSGKAIKVSNNLIDANLVIANRLCISNDAHIIALARADRLRTHLLCTDDQALKVDFQNKALIDKPRGKIYSPTRHKESIANC